MAFENVFGKFGLCIFAIIFLTRSTPALGYGPLKQLLDNMFANYDGGIRPYYGDKPVKVGLTAFIISIENVDEENNEFTTTMYMRQSWMDPRLKFTPSTGIGVKGSNDTIVLDASKSSLLWVPDTFIVNEKSSIIHKFSVPNEFFRIKSDGTVLKSQRVTLTSICPMDLRYFPLDTQTCSIELESFGYTSHDLQYFWTQGLIDSVGISNEVELPEFQVLGHKVHETSLALSSGNYTRLFLRIHFKRSAGKYILRYYSPLTMFVSISIMALWLSRPELGAIITFLNVGFINLFMAFAQGRGLKHGVSYKTALDNYVSMCLYYCYACLLVSILNLHFASNKKSQSELIELQVIRRGTENSASEDTHNLCEEGQQNRNHRPNAFPVSQIQHWWTTFKTILEIVCKHISWAFVFLFVLSVIIYWVKLVANSEDVPADLVSLDAS